MNNYLTRQDIYELLYACKFLSMVCMFGEDQASRHANKHAVQNTWKIYNEQKSL